MHDISAFTKSTGNLPNAICHNRNSSNLSFKPSNVKMSKRKTSHSEKLGDPLPKQDRQGNCILHTNDSKMTQFTYFSELDKAEERFQKILDIRGQRLTQPLGSPHRMEQVCEQIPQNFTNTDGYHRDCYQRFTMNLNRLKPATQTGPQTQTRSKRSRSSDGVIFDPKCIFCGSFGRKKVRRKKSWTTEGLSSFEYGGGDTLLRLAETRQDEPLLRQIRGYDLFSCEAKYHQSCRAKYNDPEKWRSENDDQKELTNEMEESRDMCFRKLCEVIDRKIIYDKGVMTLTDLRDMYVSFLADSPFPNPNYRTGKLKSRLMRHKDYSEKLSFVNLDRRGGKLQSELIFSNETNLAEAVKNGYMLGCSNMIDDVGNFLHRVITDAFEKGDPLPWPPTASYLQMVDDPVPEDLQRFLHHIICGQNSVQPSERTNRLVSSIGQDLCRAATRGQWKLPKHILVCMTLRHLFRSAKLSTLMNRLGHAESYSFSLELETALATALDEASSLLSPQIVRNPCSPSLFHSDFDNFDQFVNDLSGSGSVHTAHGIMLQNVPRLAETETVPNQPAIQSVERTGMRSLKSFGDESLPPCYINQRDSPVMNIVHVTLPVYDLAMSRACNMNRAWCIFRVCCADSQVVPGWAGFISETGTIPECLTTIDYYPVINHPITDYATVQECLRVSRVASQEVGQRYAITTFDLGVCMKAYPIIWKTPDFYSDHIVMIGSFHLCCAYLKMTGKKMMGSGFTDILIEAGLMSAGSMDGVVSGKNYSRSINCHKVMAEAIERMLLLKYHDDTGSELLPNDAQPELRRKVNNFLENRDKESLEIVLNEATFVEFLDNYSAFRTRVSNGSLGKTAQFWLSYADHVWMVLSLNQAVKTNDYYLYGSCLFQMADLFFSFDGQNYARYLTFFSVFLTNIETTHPGATDLLKMGAISVARSFVPGSQCPVDKTIEETFMRHAKSRAGPGSRGAGVSGLLQNYEAYRRWARTAHERSKYVDVMLQMADMTDEGRGNTHRDVRPSMIKRSEKDTAKVIDAFDSFMNPFRIDSDEKLYCIASGKPATPEVESAVMSAESVGKQAKDEFIEERLKKDQKFFEPIRRQRLKTFADMGKAVVVKTTNNRHVLYRQQSNVAFQLLVRSQDQPEKIELKELVKYPLMPVPSAIGTADGFLLKTNKAKGFDFLTKGIEDADIPPDVNTLNIEDGNATFYSMKEVPATFRQISEKLFDVSTARKSSVLFSTDMYQENSIKSLERSSRGSGEERIIKGESTKRPEKWKEFLSNDINKQQLIKLIIKVWSNDAFAPKLEQKTVIAICDEKAYKLSSDDGVSVNMTEVPELQSSQEETDTRVILYCSYAADKGYDYVRVRSPDSDIFFILLYYAGNLGIRILFDTGTGNKRRLLDITKLANDFTPVYCAALLALHAFTRCDTTSAFKGVGKVKPIKLLQKQPRYQGVFQELGQSWEVTDDLFLQLQQFTCQMYRTKSGKVSKVDELRCSMLLEKCGGADKKLDAKKNFDLSSLPPPEVCLREHVKRVNYQVAIWKRGHVPNPEIPSPADDNGWVMVNGTIEPKWYEGESLPPQLADILQRFDNEDDTDSGSDDEQFSDGESEDGSDSDSDND